MWYSAVVADLVFRHPGEGRVGGPRCSRSERGVGRLGRGGMTVGTRQPIEDSSDAASGMSGESGNGILFCCRCDRCKFDFGAEEGECF